MLFLIQRAREAVRKQKLNWILGWNAALTLGLLWILFIPPSQNPPAAPQATTPESLLSHPSWQAPIHSIDSLALHGREYRSEILQQKTYSVNIALNRGSVITIWHNDWPVVSEVVHRSGKYHYPLDLNYDRNNLRIGVWNEQQQLVYEDHFEITYKNAVVEVLRRPVLRGSGHSRKVALTFDGGSVDTGAREILAILSEKNLRTTMFITGQFIERYPELVLEMLEAGHEIGNHTYDHPHLTTYEENYQHDTAPGVTRQY